MDQIWIHLIYKKMQQKNLQQQKQANILHAVIHKSYTVYLIGMKKNDHCRGNDCMENFCKD